MLASLLTPAADAIEPSAAICLAWTLVCTALAWLVGRLLVPSHADAVPLETLALRLAAGITWLAGALAVAGLGRWNGLALLPLLLTLAAIWLRLRRSDTSPRESPPRSSARHDGETAGTAARPELRSLLMLASTFAVTYAGTWIWNDWTRDDHRIERLNMDLPSLAQLARGLPEAGVMSFWSGTLGASCRDFGETADLWYHWTPAWLVFGASRLSGMGEVNVLLFVVAPLLNFALVVVAAAAVRRLTGMPAWQCLAAGAASIVALSFPAMAETGWLLKIAPPGDLNAHVHTNLTYQFSYKCEALLVFAALLAWLRSGRVLAAMLLVAAAVSAPHTVASGGVIAGTLLAPALVRRDRAMAAFSLRCIALLLLGWALLHFLFSMDLPKAPGSVFIDLRPDVLLNNAWRTARSIATGVLLAAVVMPGLWHWCRSSKREAQMIGWLGLCALAGSYAAYQFLLPEGDRSHFTLYAHALFVLPLGVWGLAAIRRVWSSALLFLAVVTGVFDMAAARTNGPPRAITTTDLAQVKKFLAGRPWGYFAASDRFWWISDQAMLANLLGTRCIRLTPVETVDHAASSRFYGTARPEEFLPRLPDETDAAWALRFADKLGIHHIISTAEKPVPDSAIPRLRVAMQVPGLTVYER
ncbi:MAG: hypothetical protein K1X78_08885 [Verrucomicrobiaceae bacterium]|nr:hypothetical protein [Verrucomicrobiaceae bacterium]